tara:strand:+ start:2105 stop:3328 length:1224 start_codon:yes stop_codon:yes gene_type:complete
MNIKFIRFLFLFPAVLLVGGSLATQSDFIQLSYNPPVPKYSTPHRYIIQAGSSGQIWSPGEFESLEGFTQAVLSETHESEEFNLTWSRIRFDDYSYQRQEFGITGGVDGGGGPSEGGGDEGGGPPDDGGGGDEGRGINPLAGMAPGGGGETSGGSDDAKIEDSVIDLLDDDHVLIRNKNGEVLTSQGIPLELVKNERERANVSLGQIMEYFHILRFPDRTVKFGETWVRPVYLTIPGLRTLQKIDIEYRLPIRDVRYVQGIVSGGTMLSLPNLKAYRLEPSIVIDMFGFARFDGQEVSEKNEWRIDRDFIGTLELTGRAYINPETDKLIDMFVGLENNMKVYENQIPTGETKAYRQSQETRQIVQQGLQIIICEETAQLGYGSSAGSISAAGLSFSVCPVNHQGGGF